MSDNGKVIGCMLTCLHLMLVLPLWFILMGWLLLVNDAPTWAWVLFCVYAPASFLMGLMRAVTEDLLRKE